MHPYAPQALLALSMMTVVGCGPTASSDESQGGSSGLLESLSAPLSTTLDSFEGRATWIDTYGAIPAKCVARTDPGIDKGKALFDGCYDWHSSVHAHWAVLRMDLTGGGTHADLARSINGRLTTAQLTAVRNDLTAAATYEMPYGRAWLLRLVTEYKLWAAAKGVSDTTRMDALGDFSAASIMSHYAAQAPTSDASDYANDPWAVAQLLAYFRARGNTTDEQTVLGYVTSSFEAHPIAWADTNDHLPSAFFSKYWSWVYVIAKAKTAAETLTLIPPEDIPDAALEPRAGTDTLDEVHHFGINWSRAWAIKAYARRVIEARGAGDAQAKRLVESYQKHVLAGRERHYGLSGRLTSGQVTEAQTYYAYDHWVPQFAIYAITD